MSIDNWLVGTKCVCVCDRDCVSWIPILCYIVSHNAATGGKDAN